MRTRDKLLGSVLKVARYLPGRTCVANLLNGRGDTLRQNDRALEALACYEQALLLDAGHVKALYNRGNVLLGLGQARAALESYGRAVQLRPDYADAHYNRGIALQRLGRASDAIASYEQALSLMPQDPDALNNLGNALLDLRRPDEALASYDRALGFRPQYADALTNRGNALRDMRRPDEAIDSYERALAIKPDNADTLYNLGHALAETGRNKAAVDCYRKAFELNPAYAEARWSMVMAVIPRIPAPDENSEVSRADFAAGVAELETYFDAHDADGLVVVGSSTPFYLAYQEKNNRDLLSAYGRLCVRLMQRWRDKQSPPDSPEPRTGRALRVGIVSAFVRRHSVWNAMVKGWISHLDRNSVELHLFGLGPEKDDETEWAKAHVESFHQGTRGLPDWVAAICAKRLDVLIYPEIGMDPMTLKLASLRLAPVQAAGWGHPETSGLPTMDYYLSADAFEPAGAQANYSEKLIALPNLGCCYTPLPVEPVDPDLEKLGIGAGAPLLICPGAPFKYSPQYDLLLVDIARRLRKCRFVFFTWQVKALSDLLHRRLENRFAESGLRFSDYGVFIPWQTAPEFYGLMRRADVFLDTTGFSGFNTAMQAVECNLPIVTRDGRFMRGRLASGILKRMGMQELIAANDEEYVHLAVRLAEDAAYRERIRLRMRAAEATLYNDISSVQALEQALLGIAG